eukprot:4174201-Prymnesium_polylepis.2
MTGGLRAPYTLCSDHNRIREVTGLLPRTHAHTTSLQRAKIELTTLVGTFGPEQESRKRPQNSSASQDVCSAPAGASPERLTRVGSWRLEQVQVALLARLAHKRRQLPDTEDLRARARW